MNAWFGFAGSTAMPLTNRSGVRRAVDPVEGRRSQAVGSSAFYRHEHPAAAQAGPQRPGVARGPLGGDDVAGRAGVLVRPQRTVPDRSPARAPPSGCQSPQVVSNGPVPKNSLHWVSSWAWIRRCPASARRAAARRTTCWRPPGSDRRSAARRRTRPRRFRAAGPAMKSQPSSSFPLKLTSPFGEKNVCIRIFELATLMPDWPPSPKMVTDHFLPFVVACVPLSWVPPWMSFGLLALDRQALELERREPVVQRRDRLRNLREPVLAVGQVAPRQRDARAPSHWPRRRRTSRRAARCRRRSR